MLMMNETNLSSERRVQAAHLLRRAGFGGSATEIAQFAALSHAESVESLLNLKYDGNLAFDLERRLREDGYEADLNDMAYWWLVLMTRTKQPLQEKMTLFWHGHFTSSFSKVKEPIMLLEQNELYRNFALGNFKDFVKAVARNPAMIDYLDGQANRKAKPNENFARELLELFTIGIGNYTEQDVREAARAFTGWSFKDRTFVFQANQHDDGNKTFMGKTGKFDGDDIIDIVLSKPETARNIVSKLWKFFVYDKPEPAVVERLSKVFLDSNYNLKETMKAIFLSPEFLSPKAYRSLVKSPVEYVIGMLKDINASNVEGTIARAAAGMGQVLFNPPTVKGWDGGLSWINSSYFFDRVNLANLVVSSRGQQGLRYDPYTLIGQKPDAALAVVNTLIGSLLDGNTSDVTREAVVEYLNGGSKLAAKDFELAASGKPLGKPLDSRLRGTLHLLMSSPDYMLK